MEGNAKVIKSLNKLLSSELAAMDQYFIHSRMYEDWGVQQLFKHIDHEFEEEKDHADKLIKRILFLEGIPDMVTRQPIHVGNDIPSMLKNDLELEYAVANSLKEVIKLCEKENDYVTCEILQVLLKDTEEDHAYWLEKQLGLIEKVGLKNYIQSKM